MANAEYKHLYNTAAWSVLRRSQLLNQPLCEMHSQMKKTVMANIVDHITPHKGDEELFFDISNLQSLCKSCHDRHKQRQERSGVLSGGGVDGMPSDPLHHWYQEDA